MGQKVCENLPGVRMRLYGKIERDACRSVSVMPGGTDRQADELFLMYLIGKRRTWLCSMFASKYLGIPK